MISKKLEDIRDQQIVAKYEERLKAGKIRFENADDLVKKIKRERGILKSSHES
jgi:hypothetical protein